MDALKEKLEAFQVIGYTDEGVEEDEEENEEEEEEEEEEEMNAVKDDDGVMDINTESEENA